MLEPTPSESMVRLEQFNLVPSSVDGVRSSDVIVESVRQHCTLLKESNPAYAGLINDPFASRLPAQSPPAVHPPRPKKSSQGRPSSPQAASLASRPTLPTPPTRGITRPVVSDSDESDGDHHYRVPAKKSNGASNGATQVKRAPAARKRGRDEAPEPRRRPRKPTPTSSKGTRAKARKAKGQTEITQFCYPKLPLHQSAPSSDDNSSVSISSSDTMMPSHALRSRALPVQCSLPARFPPPGSCPPSNLATSSVLLWMTTWATFWSSASDTLLGWTACQYYISTALGLLPIDRPACIGVMGTLRFALLVSPSGHATLQDALAICSSTLTSSSTWTLSENSQSTLVESTEICDNAVSQVFPRCRDRRWLMRVCPPPGTQCWRSLPTEG